MAAYGILLIVAFGLGLISVGANDDSAARTTTFQWRGRMQQQRDQAHVGLQIHPHEVLADFNSVVKAVDESETRAKKVYKVRHSLSQPSIIKCKGSEFSYAQIYLMMRQPLKRVAEKLSYFCDVTQCSVQVAPVDMPTDTLRVSSVERLSTATSSYIDHPERVDRQAIAAVALGAISIGLSIYSLYEVQNLKSQMFVLQDNQDKIFHVMEEHQEAIERNRKAVMQIVNHLNTEDQWIRDTEERQRLDEFYLKLESYCADIEAWIDGLERLLFDQRPSPRFIHKQMFDNAVQRLSLRAGRDRLELAFKDFNDVINAPLSYIIENDVVYVMFHVPLVDSQDYNLYSLVDAPVRTPAGKTVRLNERKRFLATDAVNSEFITLSEEEFQKCTQVRGRFICQTGVTSKDPDSSCLSALYVHHASAATLCDFSQTIEVMETVTQVSIDEVIVTVPTEKRMIVLINCDKGQAVLSKEIEVATAKKIKIPPSCVISTDHFSFRPATFSGMHEDFVTREIAPPTFLKLLERLPVSSDEFPALNITEQELPPLPELPHLQHIQNHISLLESVMVIVGCCVVVAFIGFVLVYVIKKNRKEKKLKRKREKLYKEVEMKEIAKRASREFLEEVKLGEDSVV